MFDLVMPGEGREGRSRMGYAGKAGGPLGREEEEEREESGESGLVSKYRLPNPPPDVRIDSQPTYNPPTRHAPINEEKAIDSSK